MSEFYTIKEPVAKKAHRCEECRSPILPGQKYARHSGKQEGYMFDVTVCLRCQGMRSAAWRVFDWDEGPIFGELRTELIEKEGIADPEAWYDAILAERRAQHELSEILGEALRNYQNGFRP